jgi:hypothetical protein
MSVVSRVTAKTYFETGDVPTQAQFENLIDSAAWKYESVNHHAFRFLGSKIVGQPLNVSMNQVIGGMNVTNQQGIWSHLIVHEDGLIDGFYFWQVLQGAYTSNGFNGIALFTIDESTGTLTQVAITANTGDLWKGTSNTRQGIALTSAYTATAGVHYVCALYCSSAQTTQPQIGIGANMANATISSIDFPNSIKLNALYSSMGTSIPSSQALSHASMAANNIRPWFATYRN